MIWYILFGGLVTLVNVIFSFLPSVVTFDQISWGGHLINSGLSIDSGLVTAFGYWNSFLAVFWPFQIVWTMVLWYYAIKIGLFVTKMLPFVGRAV